MRTIKFRGKRLDNGTWETGGIAPLWIGTSRETWHIVDKVTGYLIPVDPTTAGQFTGLFDKNGTEIYEGDIMQICNDIAVVEFSANGFYQKSINGGPTYCNFNKYEVVGNIHDNPELLKNE